MASGRSPRTRLAERMCTIARYPPIAAPRSMSYARLPLLLALLTGTAAAAQPSELVVRPPALDRLEFFVGTWTLRDLPDDQAYRETCGWVGERRHVVCHSRQEWPAQVWEGTSVFSYVHADSTLRLYYFAGRGDPEMMTGRLEGDAFVFLGETAPGVFPMRRRMTITPTETGYDVVGEESTAGAPWRVLARFGYIRVE